MESAPELLRIPKIFVTPIEERGVSVLATPSETEAFPQILSAPLPERAKPQILSTPIDSPQTSMVLMKSSDLPEGFKWDVKEPKEATKVGEHGQFGKIYKDPTQMVGTKEVWWTKDRAGHGGSKYKLYKEEKREFKWMADLDETGKVLVNKHKGPRGRDIDKSRINWKGGEK